MSELTVDPLGAWASVQPESSRRLMLAAIAAFSVRGYHATTTRDIAAAAQMSPAAVYVHFRSKEALLFRIASIGHEQCRLVIQEAGAAGGPAVRLASMVRAFATWHAIHHATGRVVQYEVNALTPEHRAVIEAAKRSIDGDVRAVVESGVASGEFSVADVAGAALTTLSLCVDVARWYQAGCHYSPTEIGDLYAATALRIVGHRAR